MQGQPLDEVATRALVEKIAARREAKPFLKADYREEKSGGILARPAVTSGKLWYAAPDKFRKESAGTGRESVVVSNGEILWMYYPAFQEAERYDLKKQKLLNQGIAAFTTGLDFARVGRDFTITADGNESGYMLQLAPKNAAIGRLFTQLTVHFDHDLLLESVETVSPRGEKIQTRLSNLQNEPIPAATFDFTPPAGANVTTPLGK